MNTVEQALEKVKQMDELQAGRFLDWSSASQPAASAKTPLGIDAMVGYARRFNPQPRTTAEWLAELREGEHE